MLTPETSTRTAGRRTLGRYQLLAPIGDGGMGTVHLARFLGPGGASKKVAIKLIHSNLSQQSSFVEMFLQEMRIAMGMTHRNIVQTFDAGEHDSEYYMVMELVDGCSLRELLSALAPSRKEMPLGLAIFIAAEVCSALEYAHAYDSGSSSSPGVLHRDISPGNVLLTSQGDVKLADFGLVRAASRVAISTVTSIKGKLVYMPAEQAVGREEPRSDLFALAAVLYEMIGGKPIRQSATLDAVRQHSERIRPLSELRPDVPRPVTELISACLAKRVDDRPASAARLRSMLTELLHSIQRDDEVLRDPHALLRTFLAEQLPRPRHGSQAGEDPRPEQLVGALMERALEVPTYHPSSTRPLQGAFSASVGDLGTLRRGWIAHRWLGYAVSALLLGSVAVAFMVLRASPPRPTKPVVAVKRRPADTGAVVAPAVPAADGAGVELDAAPAADGAGLDIDATPSRRPTPKRSLNNRRRGNSKKRPARRRGILPPHRLGHLDINSVPWAHVYIGRRYAGETPAQGIALSPGRHTVRLVNPSHGISKTIVVRIVAGQHVRKVVRLER